MINKTALSDSTTVLHFEESRLLPDLCGSHDQNLHKIEKLLGVYIHLHGSRVQITGPGEAITHAATALRALYARLEKGLTVEESEVRTAVALSQEAADPTASAALCGEDAAVHTPRRIITPRSQGQYAFIKALHRAPIVFVCGPAGTGKTYLAVAHGLATLIAGNTARLVLSRPAVEAGEYLGYLPGDLRNKVDPFLRPLYDALHDMLPATQVRQRLSEGSIEIAPLGYMRGRTLSDSVIILDEAQNTTREQMRLFLTRLGHKAQMIIAGDPTQSDLKQQRSGLQDAAQILSQVKGIAFVTLSDRDIARPEIVADIVRAYEHPQPQP